LNRKGLEDFYALAGKLGDDIVMILVGLAGKQILEVPEKLNGVSISNDNFPGVKIYIKAEGIKERAEVSKPQMNINKLICIEGTDSAAELAGIYTAADYYINPTYEDNYPTTNLEAIACDTPVITYDTGGSVESAKRYGAVVTKDVNEIVRVINEDLIERRTPSEPEESMTEKYLALYSGIMNGMSRI